MQVLENIQAAVDFVKEAIAKQGNVLTDTKGELYFVDDVIAFDDVVAVVADNKFFVLCIHESQFFIKGNFDEAANESVFWRSRTA